MTPQSRIEALHLLDLAERKARSDKLELALRSSQVKCLKAKPARDERGRFAKNTELSNGES